jgi:hypothetical protein
LTSVKLGGGLRAVQESGNVGLAVIPHGMSGRYHQRYICTWGKEIYPGGRGEAVSPPDISKRHLTLPGLRDGDCQNHRGGRNGHLSLQGGGVRYLLLASVADPGCLSRIRIFSIPDPGSKRSRIPDPDPHLRIQIFLNPKVGSKLAEI